MTTLYFPSSYTKHKYRHVHFSYIIHTAKMSGIQVVITHPTADMWVGGVDNDLPLPVISAKLDNTRVMFDFMDHPTRHLSHKFPNVHYFKMQFDPNVNTEPNTFPMGPVYGFTFQSTDASGLLHYDQIRTTPPSNTTSNIISCRQKIHGSCDSRERRATVQRMLSENYSGRLDTIDDPQGNGYGMPQHEYWASLKNARMVVCVPGATHNSLDRNQIEAIGLGTCTISPEINILLPRGGKLIPGIHYVKCNDDFSNLIETIEWVDNNPETCATIRRNAWDLFDKHCTPSVVWDHITQQTLTHI